MKFTTTRFVGMALVTGVSLWGAKAWGGPGNGPFGPFGSEGAYGGLGPYSLDPYHNTMGLYSEDYWVSPASPQAEAANTAPQEVAVAERTSDSDESFPERAWHTTTHVAKRSWHTVEHAGERTGETVKHTAQRTGRTVKHVAQSTAGKPAPVAERTHSTHTSSQRISNSRTIRNTPTPVGEGNTVSSPSHSASPAYPNADIDYNNPYR